MSDVVDSADSGWTSRPVAETVTATTATGRTVAYVEYGDPTGTPVVLFHGTPGFRVLGELFAGVARGSDVRLLAIDRPGYGRSDPWPDRSLGDAAAFVDPVLDDAGVPSADVVGFSGGGPHALALAAARPELVETVDVVAGTPPPSLTERQTRVQRVLGRVAEAAPELLSVAVRAQAWLAARTSPAVVVSQYTSDGGEGEVSDFAADVVRRDFVEAVGGHGGALVTESRLLAREWDFALGDVEAPVTLWQGDADRNVPRKGVRRLANELPDAELSVLADADHLNALLRFRENLPDRYAP